MTRSTAGRAPTRSTSARGTTPARTSRPAPAESHLGAAVDVLVADPDLAAEPDQGVELAVHHALLHRDDRVVGDVDVLGTHLGAALGDVAHPETRGALGELAPVVGVERVHVELGVPQ